MRWPVENTEKKTPSLKLLPLQGLFFSELVYPMFLKTSTTSFHLKISWICTSKNWKKRFILCNPKPQFRDGRESIWELSRGRLFQSFQQSFSIFHWKSSKQKKTLQDSGGCTNSTRRKYFYIKEGCMQRRSTPVALSIPDSLFYAVPLKYIPNRRKSNQRSITR